jgi:hypothetical protein
MEQTQGLKAKDLLPETSIFDFPSLLTIHIWSMFTPIQRCIGYFRILYQLPQHPPGGTVQLIVLFDHN